MLIYNNNIIIYIRQINKMEIIKNFKNPSAKLFFIIYRLWKTD